VELTVPSGCHPDVAAIVRALRAAGADVGCCGVGEMLVDEARRSVTCAAEAAEVFALEALPAR
jgi:hypothetical protein